MSYRKYQYKILCEDRNHYHFVRGWLLERGAEGRRISLHGRLPHSPGSGKEYVRNHFEDARLSLRRQPDHSILIIVMDADNLSPHDAEQKYLAPIAPDKVFFIVPRWSIETWARWLLEPERDKACDESESCKNRYNQAQFGKLGRQLSELMRTIPPLPPMPASLQRAIQHVTQKLPEI